ncbi:uncharacterized protein LOC141594444 [Silene latifolia]|uniref:uncharacterized protein LOC141594444 n=1 Tax=Silene latifolia TaxID=37657 RepID=UPI003D782808
MASSMQAEPQRQVYANMTNHTSNEMRFERYMNFTRASSPVTTLPPIPAGETLSYDQVVWKGAFVYTGYNKRNFRSSWVLAWDARVTNGIPSPRKVYVACGYKDVIDKMTPEEIEKNLDDASDFSNTVDPITKTTGKAVIIGAVPNDSANVSANFGLFD